MKIAIDSLLQPIRQDAPEGDDLAFSSEFDAVQEARREEDASLDQGDWIRDVKEADWQKVVDLTSELLSSRSKDIRIAGWLAEGLGHLHSFDGLADGLSVLRRLTEDFWPRLYPLPEGEDQEERVGALTWIVQRSAELVRSLPLAEAPAGAFSWANYESACAWQNVLERNPDGADAATGDRLSLEGFRAACAATPPSFYATAHAGLQSLKAAVTALEAAIDDRIGRDGPSFAPLRDAVEEIALLVDRLARDANALPAAHSQSDEPAADDGGALPIPDGPIQTRAQALRQLRLVADFFRRTEPHSPVAYLADKAAAWGNMPLHLWLKQVVKDSETLAHLEELLGTESPSGKTGD